MPLSPTAKNTMLQALAGQALFASLHFAYPGDTGASEIVGGAPPYARQPTVWNPAAGGNLDDQSNQTWQVPAGTVVAWIGFWTLAAVGVYQGCIAIGSSDDAHPFTVDDADDTLRSDNHGLTDGMKVWVQDTEGGVLPTGLVEGDIYFVRDATADTFKLAATSGGAAIDLTADGNGFVQVIVPETFGSQGTFTSSDIDLSLGR